jgi:SAM-dependent methyltransferase
MLDVGCGSGASVEFLMRQGYDIKGVDLRPPDGARAGLPIYRGGACALPCDESELDGILCECVFSLLASPGAALSEFNRALKPRGALLVSDLYAKSPDINAGNGARSLRGAEAVVGLLEDCRFRTEHFEDRSDSLNAMYAQMILDGKEMCAPADLPFDINELKRVKCGYFLLVARAVKRKERQNAGLPSGRTAAAGLFVQSDHGDDDDETDADGR